uniref:Uncharacterized protein n=1 Tax=Tetranychus urticae TaxID=32264 RepID=T1KDI9_TETUR
MTLHPREKKVEPKLIQRELSLWTSQLVST